MRQASALPGDSAAEEREAFAQLISHEPDPEFAAQVVEQCRCLLERLADAELRASARAGLASAAREHWSWEGVARGVIAAARGEVRLLRAP